MDFLDKVTDAIGSKGKELGDKAKMLADIAELRSQIGTCEEVVKKNYMEIGRLYYEKNKDSENPGMDFREQCDAISHAHSGIEALEEKIREKKGI